MPEKQGPELSKQYGTDVISLTRSEYLDSFIHNLTTPKEQEGVQEALDLAIKEAPADADFCVISDQVGDRLSARHLFRAAAEAYEFSYVQEAGYTDAQVQHAEKYAKAVDSFIKDDSDLIPKAEKEGWLLAKQSTIDAVNLCLIKDHDYRWSMEFRRQVNEKFPDFQPEPSAAFVRTNALAESRDMATEATKFVQALAERQTN